MAVCAPQQPRSAARRLRVPQPRAALRDVYRTPEPAQEALSLVRLDRNERVGELPRWFLTPLRRALDSRTLTAYPRQAQLRTQLAEHLEVESERVLLAPGSDAVFKALYQAYVRPGDRVVMLEPSYAMYPVYARMFEAQAVPVPFEADRTLNLDALLDRIGDGVRVVVLANPNQPTGTVMAPRDIQRVIDRAGEVGALVAVDEAYYPFSKDTVLLWVRRFANLLVTRTFSKAAGLAGLRLGFAVGHPEVIANLAKVRTAHDVNSVAILYAEQVLAHPRLVDNYVIEVDAGRRVLSARAQRLGLAVLPTHGNFLVIRVAPRADPSQVVEGLRRLGYLVKGPFDAPCLAGCIRVTLGPPQLMARFADALRAALEMSTVKGTP